ncbi:MAG: hypothetical protein SVK08_01625 [Halobacteriota archaeon]|nr:hypothetical protein [Halobacteriota archaeon]
MSTTQTEANFDVVDVVLFGGTYPALSVIDYRCLHARGYEPISDSAKFSNAPQLLAVDNNDILSNPFAKVTYDEASVFQDEPVTLVIDASEKFHRPGPSTIIEGRKMPPRRLK